MSAAQKHPYQDARCARTAEPGKWLAEKERYSTIWLSSRECSKLATILLHAAVAQDVVYLRFVKSGSISQLIVSTPDAAMYLETSSSSQPRSTKQSSKPTGRRKQPSTGS